MKWRGRRTSGNIEDRRRSGGMRGGARGGGGMRVAGGGGLGLVAVVLIGLFLGVDLTPLLQGGPDLTQSQAPAGPNQIDDETEAFVSVVLADTEEIWTDIFNQSGLTYEEPVLVLYSGVTASACGTANAAVGPFYCPNDRRIFLDTDFFGTLANRLGAKGDFAAAYVIAHEVAHHVQNSLGVLEQVNDAKRRLSEPAANALSVRVELQADCYSGIWAREAQQRFGSLERGDIEEALNAASKIGDDALQRQSQGYVVPDSFTHGTSEQRTRWFARGYESGDPMACDTFKAQDL